MSAACPTCAGPLLGEPPVCPRCFLARELPPLRLGRLELLEEIGHGGMGIVFRARHGELGRDVAVKVLSRELADRPGFEERFQREARMLARLAHPGIVAVHDAGREDGESYIVMELAPGTPLGGLLPMAEPRAVATTLQVCEALAHAHAQGIVHRDIKPENVLVDAEGRVKVTDFGIAVLHEPDPGQPRLTEPGWVVGTPGYVAPESLAGAPAHPAMDVFAVGALLAEMVTGKPPAQALHDVPASLAPVVERAMHPDPARRHGSIGELAADLRGARRARAGDLPVEERLWLQAVALVLTTATAAALYALLVSVTPRVLAPGEIMPLTMVGMQRLGDGRVVSPARFETGPVLAALLAAALAAAAFGALRAHWRRAGLDRGDPAAPLPGSRRVAAVGGAAFTIFAVRRAFLMGGIAGPYVPVLGGLLEVSALYLFWETLLHAARTSRPLRREPLLWVGTVLFLVPPVTELASYLSTWTP